MDLCIGITLLFTVSILQAVYFNNLVTANLWVGGMGSGKGMVEIGAGDNGGLAIRGEGNGKVVGAGGFGSIPKYLLNKVEQDPLLGRNISSTLVPESFQVPVQVPALEPIQVVQVPFQLPIQVAQVPVQVTAQMPMQPMLTGVEMKVPVQSPGIAPVVQVPYPNQGKMIQIPVLDQNLGVMQSVYVPSQLPSYVTVG